MKVTDFIKYGVYKEGVKIYEGDYNQCRNFVFLAASDDINPDTQTPDEDFSVALEKYEIFKELDEEKMENFFGRKCYG